MKVSKALKTFANRYKLNILLDALYTSKIDARTYIQTRR